MAPAAQTPIHTPTAEPRGELRPDDPWDHSGGTKASTASNVRWGMVGVTGRQLIRFGFMLFLARLIGPENFGIVAQASVFIAFTAIFLDQGLASALIQRRRLADDDIGSVVSMNMASALVFGCVTVAVAPLIADFFGTPELTEVVRVLAISVVALALAVAPRAMLSRGMRFRSIAIAELAGALIGGLAGLAAALLGAGYWALVVQTVLTDAVLCLMLVAAAGRLPLRGSMRSLRSLWGFSSRIMGFQLLNYFSRNLDNALIGRVLGATQLGFYTVSYRVMLLPVQNLGQVAGRVTFPMYSRLQDDRHRLRHQFLAGSRLIALVAFPLMALVIVGAPLGVPLVFGEAWEPAVIPMQILAVTGMRQSVMTTTGSVMMACGRADWQLRWGLASSVVTVGAIVAGLQFGIVGVAAAYTLSGTVLLTPTLIAIVGRLLDFTATSFAKELLPVATATIAMIVAGTGLQLAAAQPGVPEPVVLAAGLCGASAMYLTVLKLRWSRELAEGQEFLRLMLRREGA